jgi:hypothetical protein
MFAGQAICGGSASTTVTVKTQAAALLDASVAVQVTPDVPTGKNDPEAGEQTTVTPGQLSVAEGLKTTAAPH